MVVMVTGPSFNNISWRTYIGKLEYAGSFAFTDVAYAHT